MWLAKEEIDMCKDSWDMIVVWIFLAIPFVSLILIGIAIEQGWLRFG